ncbi:MAG: hypothetical protein V3573_03955 [Desulfovibrionaceae bacterium]
MKKAFHSDTFPVYLKRKALAGQHPARLRIMARHDRSGSKETA